MRINLPKERSMLLKQALEEKELDYRIRERLIEEGKLKKEEVEKYLKDLPSEENNMEISKVE